MEEAEFEKKGRVILKTVPWMNKLEYETVSDKLYSDDPIDQRWAVDRVSSWVARGHSAVPLGVDATEALVRAKVVDYTVAHSLTVCNFADVSLMYSMALVRFVNLIVEQGQHNEHRLSLRRIAQKQGIPDWIIELRHQATHSSLPSLEKLRSATETCLQWLKENYWKPELENLHNFCPVIDDTDEVSCREVISGFQRSQCQVLFGSDKLGGKREKKLVLNHFVTLAKEKRKCLINTLVKPEFLLSLTACSKPLLESSDRFIQEEAVALPKNIEMFWQPVISILHHKDLLGELILSLLKSLKNLSDENQRMAMAWVWKIVEASSESWGSSTRMDSEITKALRRHPPIFNWFELLDACLHGCSKYIAAVLPILIEHVFPPIPINKKNCLMGLVAISIGALADVHSDSDVPKEEQRIYNVDNIKTVLELQDVVDRGETSLYYTENPWKLCTDAINWSEYPLGYVFGLENDVVGPSALETGEITKAKTENEPGPSTESAAVSMECDVDKSINESTEISADKERIEEGLSVEEEGESYVNGFNADYCDPDDICVF